MPANSTGLQGILCGYQAAARRLPCSAAVCSDAGGKEVVVSRKAGEAVLRGAQPYVPGCVAASAGLEAGDLVAVSGTMTCVAPLVVC